MTTAPTSTQVPDSRIKGWRLWLPLTIQVLILSSIAVPPLMTEITGKTVILKTAPVDPYDPMRGYSQTLSYDISRRDTLSKLPGWKELPKESYGDYLQPNTSFYIIMQAPKNPDNTSPQPWKPIAIKLALAKTDRQAFRPETLPPNQIAIKGKTNSWTVQYGLETYYMPEDLRDQVNNEANTASRNNTSFVEIKVNAEGRAVPISLWLGKKNYRF